MRTITAGIFIMLDGADTHLYGRRSDELFRAVFTGAFTTARSENLTGWIP